MAHDNITNHNLTKESYQQLELGFTSSNIEDNFDEFLPRNEAARLAVLKSREIVRRNNEFISKIKVDSNILAEEEDFGQNAEFFSHEDSYSFDLYKIKSKVGITEMIKDIFGI